MPVIIAGWYEQAIIYFVGVMLAILFLSLTLAQIPTVLKLMAVPEDSELN